MVETLEPNTAWTQTHQINDHYTQKLENISFPKKFKIWSWLFICTVISGDLCYVWHSHIIIPSGNSIRNNLNTHILETSLWQQCSRGKDLWFYGELATLSGFLYLPCCTKTEGRDFRLSSIVHIEKTQKKKKLSTPVVHNSIGSCFEVEAHKYSTYPIV